MWHFAAGTDGPRTNYGKRSKLIAGKTYKLPKGQKPVPCERGFHASERAIDALNYAQGPWVSRVTLGGEIVPHDGDKLCASERTHHGFADATMVLHEFACWCAEQALKAERKAGREPDPRSWKAIKVKRQWMKGKATIEELDAAGAAAWDAAGDAARAAAGAAAWDAAWAAAGAAAWDAAGAAAWAAAWAAQNRKLESMLNKLLSHEVVQR